MDMAKLSDADLESQNLSLGQQAEVIREQRRAIVAELRERHQKREVAAAMQRALGVGVEGSVEIRGSTIVVHMVPPDAAQLQQEG